VCELVDDDHAIKSQDSRDDVVLLAVLPAFARKIYSRLECVLARDVVEERLK
jgi:hypothetical protein